MKHVSLQVCLVLIVFSFNKAFSQKVNFEQYYLSGDKQQSTSPTIVSYKATHNWYSEARFNYEDFNTASFYTGKSFSHDGAVSIEATPLIGVVFGNFNGGSLALNFNADYKKLSFSTQAQYTFTLKSQGASYYYNWAEITVDITPWLYTGISSQQTIRVCNKPQIDQGIVLGFSLKKFTFPVYVFTPHRDKRFIMLGLNWEWNHSN